MTESSLLFGNASVTAIENVKMIRTDNEEVIKAYGFSEGVILIRPYGYIAFITTDMDEVLHYFKRFR